MYSPPPPPAISLCACGRGWSELFDCEGEFLVAASDCLLWTVSGEGGLDTEAWPLEEEEAGLRWTISGADTMLRRPKLIPLTEESDMEP